MNSEQYSIYQITVTRPGKLPRFYIGYAVDPDARWYSHRTGNSNQGGASLVSDMVAKYGAKALEFRILRICESKEDAAAYEHYLIEKCELDRSRWPGGWGLNLCPGGGGGTAGAPVYSYDALTGEFLAEYQGAGAAARSLGVSESSIRSALGGRLQVAHGRIWSSVKYERVDPKPSSNMRAVYSIDPITNEKKYYPSVTAACEEVGLKSINPGLKDGKLCGGLYWRYVELESGTDKPKRERAIAVCLVDDKGIVTPRDSYADAARLLNCSANSVQAALKHSGVTFGHRVVKTADLNSLSDAERNALIDEMVASIKERKKKRDHQGGNRREKPCMLINQQGELFPFPSLKSLLRKLGRKGRSLPKHGELGRIAGCTFVAKEWFDELSEAQRYAVIQDAKDYRAPGHNVEALVAVCEKGELHEFTSPDEAASKIGGSSWAIGSAALRCQNRFKGYKICTKESYDKMTPRERADFLSVGPKSRSILSIDPLTQEEERYESIIAAVKATGIYDIGVAVEEQLERGGRLWRREHFGMYPGRATGKTMKVYLVDSDGDLFLYMSSSDAAMDLEVVTSGVTSGIKSSGKVKGHRVIYARDLDNLDPQKRVLCIADMVESLNPPVKEEKAKHDPRLACITVSHKGVVVRHKSVSKARQTIGAKGAMSLTNPLGIIRKGHRLILAIHFDAMSSEGQQALVMEMMNYRASGGGVIVIDRKGNVSEYKTQQKAGDELGVSHRTVSQAIQLEGIIRKEYKACFKTDYEGMADKEREAFHRFQSRPKNRSKPAVLITSMGEFSEHESCKKAGEAVGANPSSAARAAREGVVVKGHAIMLLADFQKMIQELGIKEGDCSLMKAALIWKQSARCEC